jgi:hypothetical protein
MEILRRHTVANALILSAVLLSLPAHSAESEGYVDAVSRFGNGAIRAPVRQDSHGWAVQLPGGRWIYCRRSCSETLRVETVDFFEANEAGNGQITNECGIFGCLDLKYRQ